MTSLDCVSPLVSPVVLKSQTMYINCMNLFSTPCQFYIFGFTRKALKLETDLGLLSGFSSEAETTGEWWTRASGRGAEPRMAPGFRRVVNPVTWSRHVLWALRAPALVPGRQ